MLVHYGCQALVYQALISLTAVLVCWRQILPDEVRGHLPLIGLAGLSAVRLPWAGGLPAGQRHVRNGKQATSEVAWRTYTPYNVSSLPRIRAWIPGSGPWLRCSEVRLTPPRETDHVALGPRSGLGSTATGWGMSVGGRTKRHGASGFRRGKAGCRADLGDCGRARPGRDQVRVQ